MSSMLCFSKDNLFQILSIVKDGDKLWHQSLKTDILISYDHVTQITILLPNRQTFLTLVCTPNTRVGRSDFINENQYQTK